MALSEHIDIFNEIHRRLIGDNPLKTGKDYIELGRSLITQENVVDSLCNYVGTVLAEDYEDRGVVLKLPRVIKNSVFWTIDSFKHAVDENGKPNLSDEDDAIMQYLNDIYWRILRVEARGKQVDSYFLYLEKNRQPEDKFYQPCRKQFLHFGLTQAFQGLIDDEYDILCVSMPPSTRKTTAEKFFASGVIGWYPKDYNLFFSHSADITRMFYNSCHQIVTDDHTYTWGEVFPDLRMTSQNAKMQQFNIGEFKSFPSLQTASVGSDMAGKVRANRFLMVDDLIGKLEEALNKNTLNNIWNAYSVDARQRKDKSKDGKLCKELIVATRWSVHDPIGRLARLNEGNPRFKAIAIPATYTDDDGVKHSNFEYDYGGFTVEDFEEQEKVMDEISYSCLYMQTPVEREGLLYHDEELRRYLSLPLEEPDAVVGICDTKNTGTDFMFLPVMYQYCEDYYLVDVHCDDTTNFNVHYRKMVKLIMDNGLQSLEIESNQGGKAIGTTLQEKLKEAGYSCNITLHPTETNKEARIIANSYWVKQHIVFRDKSLYKPSDQYGTMVSQLLSWSQVGRNPHDDIPDGLAIFAEYVSNRLYRTVRRTTVIRGGML